MSAKQDNRSWDVVLLKWRDLAERRRAHLFDLLESGRWRRYYSEELFVVGLHVGVAAAVDWRGLAPRPDDAGLAA
jgi:uncharacterized repeat protein (TIGR03809 family)